MRHRHAAIVVIALGLFAVPAAAQLSIPPAPPPDPTPRSDKSPTLARIIGIVPGAGHAYAGEPRRGLMWFGATLGTAIVGGSISDRQCWEDPYTDEYCSSTTLDIITAVAVAGVWGWSIVDAGRAAKRTNARRVRVTGLVMKRLPDGHGHPQTRVGISLSW